VGEFEEPGRLPGKRLLAIAGKNEGAEVVKLSR
jgi:hypothetical protein